MVRTETKASERICQGDIFRDVTSVEYIIEKSGEMEVSNIRFPYVIVLTQDCDLEQDDVFRSPESKKETQDKYLLSVLVAPLYNAEDVFEGTHLSYMDWKMEPISNRMLRDYLTSNQRARYHYLEFEKDIPLVPSVIDFKHYFSVNVVYLKSIKKANCVCKVAELYREDISQRFSSFLSRIGLP